ncbi:MAG: hypothetical protein HRT87_11445 [Legionellales bacterium]|jgi:hypothetical protein|nr:hypothetical protein [Legionellales bacterium]
MNEVQVRKLLKVMRETEDQETIKAIESVFEEEAKKINEWISGRPKERPNQG